MSSLRSRSRDVAAQPPPSTSRYNKTTPPAAVGLQQGAFDGNPTCSVDFRGAGAWRLQSDQDEHMPPAAVKFEGPLSAPAAAVAYSPRQCPPPFVHEQEDQLQRPQEEQEDPWGLLVPAPGCPRPSTKVTPEWMMTPVFPRVRHEEEQELGPVPGCPDTGGDDLIHRAKIDAKSGLLNYCITVRHMLMQTEFTGVLDPESVLKIEDAVWETFTWLRKNQHAEKDEFEAKQKELEAMVNQTKMGWVFT